MCHYKNFAYGNKPKSSVCVSLTSNKDYTVEPLTAAIRRLVNWQEESMNLVETGRENGRWIELAQDCFFMCEVWNVQVVLLELIKF